MSRHAHGDKVCNRLVPRGLFTNTRPGAMHQGDLGSEELDSVQDVGPNDQVLTNVSIVSDRCE